MKATYEGNLKKKRVLLGVQGRLSKKVAFDFWVLIFKYRERYISFKKTLSCALRNEYVRLTMNLEELKPEVYST